MCWKCEITLVFSTPHILVDINTGFVFTSVLQINITKDVLVVGESAGIAIVPGSWLTSLTTTEILAVVSRSVPSSDSRKIFDFLRLKILWDHSASYISCRRSTSKPCSTFLSTAPFQSCSCHWAANKSRIPVWLKEDWNRRALFFSHINFHFNSLLCWQQNAGVKCVGQFEQHEDWTWKHNLPL